MAKIWIAALAFSATAQADATLADEGMLRMEIKDVGFQTPESVLYDAASDTYLVSNINGASERFEVVIRTACSMPVARFARPASAG